MDTADHTPPYLHLFSNLLSLIITLQAASNSSLCVRKEPSLLSAEQGVIWVLPSGACPQHMHTWAKLASFQMEMWKLSSRVTVVSLCTHTMKCTDRGGGNQTGKDRWAALKLGRTCRCILEPERSDFRFLQCGVFKTCDLRRFWRIVVWNRSSLLDSETPP